MKMNIRKNTSFVAVAVAVIVILLSSVSGCASSPTPAATNGAPVPLAQAPAAQTQSQAAAAPERELTPQERWGIDKLIIVLLPGEDTPEMAYTRKVFDEALSEVLGIPVEEYHGTNYAACIEAMRTGHAHVALLGPFSYVHAVERAGAECFAVIGADGVHGYYSHFITHVDSDIHSLDDLKGRTFGFVDPASTSGYLVPSNDLLNHFESSLPDLEFEDLTVNGRFFSSVLFAGTHANSAQGVYRKDVEAAAVTSATVDAEIRNGHIPEGVLRTFHTSALIPASPMVIQKDLPEDLKELVKNFFYEWDDQAFWDVRAPRNPASRYFPVEDHEYDSIRQLRERFDLTD